MKTLHRIVSQFVKDETRVEISRRDLAKIRAELRRPTHPTVTERMMAHPRTHEGKCYWPSVYHREAPKGTGEVRVLNQPTEHPMITARKRQYAKPTNQRRA